MTAGRSAQTVKIVVEHVQPSLVARPGLQMAARLAVAASPKTKKAKL